MLNATREHPAVSKGAIHFSRPVPVFPDRCLEISTGADLFSEFSNLVTLTLPRYTLRWHSVEIAMATELRDFLADLATDPKSLAEFIVDADAAMEQADLADEDRKLLRSGNLAAIQARLAGVDVDRATTPQIVVVVGLDQLRTMYADYMRTMPPPGAEVSQIGGRQQMPAGAVAPQISPWQQMPAGAVAPQSAFSQQMPAGAVAPQFAFWQQMPAGAVAPQVAPWLQAPAGAVAPQVAPWQQMPAGAVAPQIALWQQAPPGAFAPQGAPWQQAPPGAVAPQISFMLVPFPVWWR